MTTPNKSFESIEVSPKNMVGLRKVAKFNAYDDLNEAIEMLLENYLDD